MMSSDLGGAGRRRWLRDRSGLMGSDSGLVDLRMRMRTSKDLSGSAWSLWLRKMSELMSSGRRLWLRKRSGLMSSVRSLRSK